MAKKRGKIILIENVRNIESKQGFPYLVGSKKGVPFLL